MKKCILIASLLIGFSITSFGQSQNLRFKEVVSEIRTDNQVFTYTVPANHVFKIITLDKGTGGRTLNNVQVGVGAGSWLKAGDVLQLTPYNYGGNPVGNATRYLNGILYELY